MNAEFLERALVFPTGVGAEDQVGVRAAVQPAIVLNFGFQLAGRPPGIAERQQGAPGAVALGDRLENVERRSETDAVIDRQGRAVDEVVVRVQHEAAAGFNRPALEHLDRTGAYR